MITGPCNYKLLAPTDESRTLICSYFSPGVMNSSVHFWWGQGPDFSSQPLSHACPTTTTTSQTFGKVEQKLAVTQLLLLILHLEEILGLDLPMPPTPIFQNMELINNWIALGSSHHEDRGVLSSLGDSRLALTFELHGNSFFQGVRFSVQTTSRGRTAYRRN